MNKQTLILFLFFIIIGSTPSHAETKLTAKNGIKWDQINQTYSANGGVRYSDNRFNVQSDSLIAFYKLDEKTNKEIIFKIELKGNVKIIQPDINDEYISDNGIYDKNNQSIILSGNVFIKSDGRVIKGDIFRYDTLSGNKEIFSNSNENLVEAVIAE